MQIARCVLFCACLLSTTRAMAATPVQCPPTADQFSIEVQSSVRRDTASGMFLYAYKVVSSSSSLESIEDFSVDASTVVTQVTRPQGWIGNKITIRPWVHWAARPRNRISPGSTASGFSFVSAEPPGEASFHARGHVELPRATSEEEAEDLAEDLTTSCPEFSKPLIDQGMTGRTVGPVKATLIGIDVKPGSLPNPVNPRSNGVIPIAVLGSGSFDVARIKRESIRLVPSGAKPVQSSPEDVNGDGIGDLMLHFRAEDARLVCGDSVVVLAASAIDGTLLSGFDEIVTPGCK